MPRPVKPVEVDMSKKAFNKSEVCLILGVSMNTVDKMIKLGQLKALKVGFKRWVIPSWALDVFLKPPQEGGN